MANNRIHGYNEKSAISGPALDSPLKSYRLLYIINIYISFFKYGALYVIQANAVLPYGGQVFILTNFCPNLCMIFVFFGSKFIPLKWCKAILFTSSSVATLLIGFIFASAYLSPNPPFISHKFGGLITVLAWTLAFGFLAAAEASLVRTYRENIESKRLLFISGVITQSASFSSVVSIYLLINFTKLFPIFNDCQ